MAKCKVCGVKVHDEEVCSSCTQFYEMKYGKSAKRKLNLFLKKLREFELNMREVKNEK